MAKKQKVFRGFRLHIGIFGRRNVGKSSLLNAITRQAVSIVSDEPGTTTDPVGKPMELLPLGPVLFIDTAGIDDVGALGELRVQKTKRVFDRADFAVIVTDAGDWSAFEDRLQDAFEERGIPYLVVLNKIDIHEVHARTIERLSNAKVPFVKIDASRGGGIFDFRQALIDLVPEDFVKNPVIAGDLVGPGELAVLVVPIDKEAPKGRLILPQVQTIRDLLDSDACCLVAKEQDLSSAFNMLNMRPKLVITDSQAFLKVAADTPKEILLTSFSILFSRFKGDLMTQVEGTLAVDLLRPGDHVLIAEACSHHPIEEDIGRVKIPHWLTEYIGGELNFTNVQGRDFPEDLSPYKLVIHCGACMFNRRAMLSRLLAAKKAKVPITNYGLVIAYSLGIFERALSPFPQAIELVRRVKDN
jgi:[FeFe] hydrogenase H-cluster maturation GTPase HydF